MRLPTSFLRVETLVWDAGGTSEWHQSSVAVQHHVLEKRSVCDPEVHRSAGRCSEWAADLLGKLGLRELRGQCRETLAAAGPRRRKKRNILCNVARFITPCYWFVRETS